MSDTSPGEMTQLLKRWREGDQDAFARLVPLIYDELRSLAAACLHRGRQGALETSALVHEAYLRLVNLRQVRSENRLQFFKLATRIMRSIIADHARELLAAKRGAGAQLLSLDDVLSVSIDKPAELIALDDALNALDRTDPKLARILELHHFGGFTYEEVGDLLGISTSTVVRRWRVARAWLYRHIAGGTPG